MFFDYPLPDRLVAQHPAERRDESRLLVVRRATGALEHRVFRELPELLSAGDLLALNDTKVIPARVVGRREATGGKWEGLFVREAAGGLWELLAQTRGYAQPGETFALDPGPLRLTLRGRTPDRHWLMEPDRPGTPAELLAVSGHVPLPPYIRKGRAADTDRTRYQTVFAAADGSVAAPTAGLHFTPELLARLAAAGVSDTRVTLHVGLGTFALVKAADPTQHAIHSEWCEVTEGAAAAVAACKARGGRVVAVGTTATRTLETAAQGGTVAPYRGETDLFIHAPFTFRAVDALVTNFHLPRTTLLLLVGAFAGGELLRRAYAEAVAREYRFFSYGDAMLVL
ncbi:tRNA preQ1(34) S-adenosylmethionine ribosyltransferase-isomerase QueA [Urbifossiella limnaea]|uniref:S-adenosylmethionine:tRNA ribosyltransferase-isomerase n=1 Tax=Urbifossiella limnaea TaxID=2528023 RepID=A0A517Y142_9BACT|nr:tRNA preQ1(34) S-adenosylmethionine ribosyltransferase-isomerase QueA [Urbifossiella limnaea]QDU23489.1 S-adenosylmethionine:tRNA ribosyltransferase-isomerase [Urbifossiella limnaea]